MKTWFLNLVVTRDVFSKCPRHCAFVSVSNGMRVIETAHLGSL